MGEGDVGVDCYIYKLWERQQSAIEEAYIVSKAHQANNRNCFHTHVPLKTNLTTIGYAMSNQHKSPHKMCSHAALLLELLLLVICFYKLLQSYARYKLMNNNGSPSYNVGFLRSQSICPRNVPLIGNST